MSPSGSAELCTECHGRGTVGDEAPEICQTCMDRPYGDPEISAAVATLRSWKARIRREALLEAAAIVERDAHEYIRTGYPVQVKLKALAAELRLTVALDENP